MERWKDIEGLEGLYAISDHGRVKTLKRYVKNKQSVRVVPERILKTTLHEKGYPRVRLSVNDKKVTKRVHRLVALHFLELVEGKSEVNHIDGNKENNHYTNLEWASRQENIDHYWRSKR